MLSGNPPNQALVAPTLTDINTHAKVGIAWFSDTILLYTREDSDDCIRALLGTVGWLLFETILEGHTRIRAGVAYGKWQNTKPFHDRVCRHCNR